MPRVHPVRMLEHVTDMTDRKQAEALIAEGTRNLARAERMALFSGHVRYDIKKRTNTRGPKALTELWA